MGQFEEKVAIVTGSGGGIGQAYAEALAREGAAVVVADINTEGAERVAAGIVAAGGTAIAVPVDVSDPDSAKAMADRTLAEFGGIDFLVNNAAIFGGMKLDFLVTVDWDYYKKFMSVNLDGALACTRAVYRKMAKRGGGAIINVSSLASVLPIPDFAVYAATKAYVTSFSEALRIELREHHIPVLAVCPGPVRTEFGQVSRRSPDGPGMPSSKSFYVPKQQVVAESLAALDRKAARVYPGMKTAVAALVLSALPMVVLRFAMGFRPRR